MKRISLLVASIMMAVTVLFVPVTTNAVSVLPQCTSNSGTTGSSAICASKNDNIGTYVKNGVNILLYLVGVLAIIMIIYGGVRYVTSAGNSNQVSSAKNVILYALVGLVVAVLAYAIVNFVIVGVTTGKSS